MEKKFYIKELINFNQKKTPIEEQNLQIFLLKIYDNKHKAGQN